MSFRSLLRVLLLLLVPLLSVAAPSAPAMPRLVLVLVVDGLPYEQLQRYRGQFDAHGGLRRLLE